MVRFLTLLLTLPFLLSSLKAKEEILSYDSRIEVLTDGAIDVTETIRVRAEGRQIKRGIYRDLPTLYRGRFGLREERPFEVLEVKRDGESEPYTIQDHKAGVRILIGRENKFLDTGEYTYTLRYRTDGQLLFFDDHDELYWNVTGNEWAFPIQESSATVILPDFIDVSTAEGYIGERGSQERPETVAGSGNEAAITTGRVLSPGEGLTVVVTWPPGQLDPGAYETSLAPLLRKNWLALLGLGLIVLMFLWHLVAWFRVGRDPEAGQIIPQFTPPEGFSPAAARMLDRMKFDNTCFSAAVMDLGVKGVLRIEEDDKKKLSLHKTGKEPSEPLTIDEEKLFEKLLGSGESIELKQKNHKELSGARGALQKSLSRKLEKTHFLKNARYWVPGFLLSLAAVLLLLFSGGAKGGAAGFMALWVSIWSLGTGALVSSAITQWKNGSVGAATFTTLFSLPFVAGWIFGMAMFYMQAGPLTAGAFIFALVINVLFYHLIKAPTHLGREVLDRIEGLKHYLTVAEADRMSGFSGPEKTPELFEKLLPYAHALGVAQEWTDQFSAVLARAGQGPDGTSYRPHFYSGTHTGFDRAMTGAALGGALTSALTSASTSPSSSGSGGGGSSGGGGGGGGGGGW